MYFNLEPVVATDGDCVVWYVTTWWFRE